MRPTSRATKWKLSATTDRISHISLGETKLNYRLPRFWVLLAAVWFFCLGLVGGPAAGLAAAITGALFWWLFIERPRILTYSQGAFVGFLVQMVAYPVLYLLSGFLGLPGFVGNQPEFTYSGPIPSGAEIVDILEGLVFSVGLFGFGVLFTGPIGIAGGLVLVALRRRVSCESESQ